MQSQMQPMQQHHVRGGGSRRGRGRSSNNSGGHRRDFNSRQMNIVQDMNHQQSSTAVAAAAAAQPPTSNYAPASYFVNPYVGLYPNQFIGHPHSSASHATGSPLYVAGAMPGYGYAYHPSMVYPMVPMDYMVDPESSWENSQDSNPQETQDNSNCAAPVPMQQPHQQMPEEYIGQPSNEFMQMASGEFIPRPEYVNHNAQHMIGSIPMFKQQEDGTFQAFPAEFIPATAAEHVAPIQNADAGIEYLQPQLSPADTFNNNENNNIINFKQSDQNEQIEQSTPQPTYDASVATNEINACMIESPHPRPIEDESVNANHMHIAHQTPSPNAHVVVVATPAPPVTIAPAATAAAVTAPPPPIASTEPIRLVANETQMENTINALANVTIEKQPMKIDRGVATTKTTSVSSSAWTPKKSTQSVAVTAVPSNNISQIETATTKAQSQTGVKANKLAVNSNSVSVSNTTNNNININNNNHSNITGGSNTNELATNTNNNNVKPIVPKVDDPHIIESTTTANDAVTSQSSEVQTIPVSDTVEVTPVVVVTPVAAPPPANSWASLFSKSNPTDGLAPSTASRIVDPTTKKPIAKVSPYNSASNEQQSAKSFSGAVPTPVTPAPIAISAGTLSYSAASTQKLPAPTTSNVKKEVPVRARIAPSAKATSSTETHHVDESSYRIGGE